ncbi:hypothetical protein [Thalassobacillus hwangdonensis]|uniref:Plasmid segregation centromere-binding protein ParR n=1 Tax=Thalassobacillus hwangdonensis TaxID=546108 RepID=A0ABW3L5F8_9BACI
MKKSGNGIQRGQAITFRVPSDTPDHIIKQLQHLKETERRNFSSKIAEFVTHGVGETLAKEKETITIPLPKQLTKAQRDWLKYEHSEALLGSILYQLIADPVRSSALLASLNSNALDINEALYLQEEHAATSTDEAVEEEPHEEELPPLNHDDLDNLNWDSMKDDFQSQQQVEVEDEDPLGGFLDKMNK